MATLKDVAEHSGVSISVVSRVLNGDPSVRARPETKARIVRSAELLRYVPNSAGRNLRNSRTHLLALVVPDVTNATFAELAAAIEVEALKRGYHLLLGSSAETQPGAAGFARLIQERRVDGVLFQKRDDTDAALVASALPDSQRVVFVNNGPLSGVSTVALPDRTAGALAADHLVRNGHRRIGFVGGTIDTSQRREQGVGDALTSAGIAPDPRLATHLGYGLRQGRDAARLLLSRPGRPTALVVANVNAAFGVLIEAAEMGIRVPEDLSIVALHDVAHVEITAPKLTTVRMPMASLGRDSVASLLRRINGGAVEEMTVDEQPVLIQRESVAAPAQ